MPRPRIAAVSQPAAARNSVSSLFKASLYGVMMASFRRPRREKASNRAVLVVTAGMPLASSICRTSVLSKPGPPTMLPVVQAKTRI